MPSRAELRVIAERVARALALVALGLLVWRRWEPPTAPAAPLRGASATPLRRVLEEATRRDVPSLTVELARLPTPTERAWLAAVARAGSDVRWSSTSAVSPVVVSVDPLPSPSGRTRLSIVAPHRVSLATRDAGGLVDSSRVGPSATRVLEGELTDAVTVAAGGAVATVPLTDSLVLRPVLVLARAGWEGKFVVAALEEAGWRVEARFTVAPSASVSQGATAAIDTARYAAVVVIDGSAASHGAAIARFVRAGGGVVLTAEGATLPSLAPLAPARPADTLDASLGALTGAEPRRGLAAVAWRALDSTAVALERRSGRPIVVAGRVGVGRVVLTGYLDSWRWRMQGGDGSDDAHRAWWSALVTSVARAPRVPRDLVLPESVVADPAPYAALVAALGPPMRESIPDLPVPPARLDAILFALALAGLLAEWASRRTRGAR